MNTELLRDAMNRLKAQADKHRANLNQYKAGLANLHTQLQKLDNDLFATRQRFEALAGEPVVDTTVMKLYPLNDQVA
ncbi:hypothetical protein IM792_00850 [Mucilaginibacter sp. JRF]|uniref:hypothetical protein n=1 Tax=Mucilaginibacter sp. JRF TaxID=2780088 RepID=UPI001882F383|nr:hypothetical protein [Mucilaginibacter sp. JRF]MBE9582985.1 hypothetical protein [Mucilaginibacter sp. JRF]